MLNVSFITYTNDNDNIFVEQIIPDVVYEDALGTKSVAYQNIVALLIEAMKDQQRQIDELKRQLG